MKIYTRRSSAEMNRVHEATNRGIHAHALAEDFSRTVAHPRLDTRSAFNLSLSGDHADERIGRGFEMQGRSGALEALVDYIEGLSSTIATHGAAWSEIAIDKSSNRFRVVPVLPDTLRQTPFGVFQVLLSDSPPPVHLIARIPRKVLWRATAPGMSPRSWRRMVSRVAALESAQAEAFTFTINDAADVPYRANEHSLEVAEQILIATNPIQYLPRNYGEDENVSQTLAAYRWAKFSAYCARARMALAQELNGVLRVVGTALGFEAVLSLDRILSGRDWDEAAAAILTSDNPNEIVANLRKRARAEV